MSKKEEGVKSATGPEMNKFLNGHFENKAPIFPRKQVISGWQGTNSEAFCQDRTNLV